MPATGQNTPTRGIMEYSLVPACKIEGDPIEVFGAYIPQLAEHTLNNINTDPAHNSVLHPVLVP